MDSPKLLEIEVGRCQLLEHEDVKIRNPLRKNTCCINEETLPLETTVSCIKSWASGSNIRRATLEMPSTEESRYSSEPQAFNLFAQKVSPS